MRIVGLDGQALALGLQPGMALADARAQVPDLATADHDAIADRALLERIADLCDRYSPMVALDPPDGISLDITGCSHLFGGEAGLAADVAGRLSQLGLTLHHACAATPDGAQALARFRRSSVADEAKAETEALLVLPVAALRLEEEVEIGLRRAGLKTVGDLARRPTAPLSARYGERARVSLDRLLGRVDSRLTPRRPPPALMFTRRFAEPVLHLNAVMRTIEALAAEAVKALEIRGKGGRRFAVRLYRSDGAARDLAVETSLPTRDPGALVRLFGERVESLADPIDPGFGFDMIRLAVPVLEPLAPVQLRGWRMTPRPRTGWPPSSIG